MRKGGERKRGREGESEEGGVWSINSVLNVGRREREGEGGREDREVISADIRKCG